MSLTARKKDCRSPKVAIGMRFSSSPEARISSGILQSKSADFIALSNLLSGVIHSATLQVVSNLR